MDELKQRIAKGVEYLDGIKPSDFTVKGIVKPNRWREYKAFLQLVKEYVSSSNEVNGGEKEKKDV